MSTAAGQTAEDAVAVYLQNAGFTIINRNWRNRFCEIDIVAQQDHRIHFVEVKYRRDDSHGSGLEYITPTKIKQLKKAALYWVHENNWKDDYQIDAASVDATGDIQYVSAILMD